MRTFFRYFSSKQHVLFGDVVQDAIERLTSALAARPAEEPVRDCVRAVIDSLVPVEVPEQKQLAQRLRLAREQPALLSAYYSLLHQAGEEIAAFVAGRGGAGLYPRLVAAAATGAANAAVWAWLEDETRELKTLCSRPTTGCPSASERWAVPPVWTAPRTL